MRETLQIFKREKEMMELQDEVYIGNGVTRQTWYEADCNTTTIMDTWFVADGDCVSKDWEIISIRIESQLPLPVLPSVNDVQNSPLPGTNHQRR